MVFSCCMDLRQIFSTNLRRIRYKTGLSQENLAYDADINRTYVSKLEKGTSAPGLEIIEKLATALDIEPYELLLPRGKQSKRNR